VITRLAVLFQLPVEDQTAEKCRTRNDKIIMWVLQIAVGTAIFLPADYFAILANLILKLPTISGSIVDRIVHLQALAFTTLCAVHVVRVTMARRSS